MAVEGGGAPSWIADSGAGGASSGSRGDVLLRDCRERRSQAMVAALPESLAEPMERFGGRPNVREMPDGGGDDDDEEEVEEEEEARRRSETPELLDCRSRFAVEKWVVAE